MAKHNEIGRIGEDVAADFLRQKGFKIVLRNFRKPYGEIDIIARDPGNSLRFIEVKSVSWETEGSEPGSVSHGTIRPEENVHPAKIKSLMRVIEAYLVSHETRGAWQFDVLAVFLDTKHKKARVRHLENVVLGS
jgi:putative endonuclease